MSHPSSVWECEEEGWKERGVKKKLQIQLCFLTASCFPLTFLSCVSAILEKSASAFFQSPDLFSPLFPLAVTFISFPSQERVLATFTISSPAWRKGRYAFAHL